MNIGVLASHEGTVLQSVLDACASGRMLAKVALVISNNSGSGALCRAIAAGVKAVHLSSRTHLDPAALDRAIRDTLVAESVDVVLLAGYMKRLGPLVLGTFAGRILNTHPALLPRFGGPGMYGDRVHEAVLQAGERETGASVHVVEAAYDCGPVISQRSVPVLPGDSVDTLKNRVQEQERELVIETLAAVAQGRIRLPVSLRPK